MDDLQRKLDEAESKIESILSDIRTSIPDESDVYWDNIDEFLTDGTMVAELYFKFGRIGIMIYHREAGSEPHAWFPLEDLILDLRSNYIFDAEAYKHFSEKFRDLADQLDRMSQEQVSNH